MSKVKATMTGFVAYEGVPIFLQDGEDYDAEHPLVQARPDLFTEPVEEPKRGGGRVMGSRSKDG